MERNQAALDVLRQLSLNEDDWKLPGDESVEDKCGSWVEPDELLHAYSDMVILSQHPARGVGGGRSSFGVCRNLAGEAHSARRLSAFSYIDVQVERRVQQLGRDLENRLRAEIEALKAELAGTLDNLIDCAPLQDDPVEIWMSSYPEEVSAHKGERVAIDLRTGRVAAAAKRLRTVREKVKELGLDGHVIYTSVPSE